MVKVPRLLLKLKQPLRLSIVNKNHSLHILHYELFISLLALLPVSINNFSGLKSSKLTNLAGVAHNLLSILHSSTLFIL